MGGAEDRSRDGVILRRFVELCGGSKARLAIIPTASQLEETGPNYEQVFEAIGVREARSLPFEQRSDCDDPEALEVLSRATGVFLTGGNQLRLSTVIGGTKVAQLLRRRNAEGLHVGGTSAGAAILSEHMIGYGDEGNVPRAGMAHLAPGLGIFQTIVVDQHFAQRNRFGRLLAALALNPRLVGLGIDENTAAFIGPDDVMRVVGEGSVMVLDNAKVGHTSADRAAPGQIIDVHNVVLHVLSHGGKFSFQTLQPV
ncbi:MAG: cyanophycinase [Acidobacteria bacterium]|nr:MAG: cyanophycinase [Acidobacteriota bacterium]REK11834.1 MAG: cyanophycinase [Acidobacteriota bacterium]